MGLIIKKGLIKNESTAVFTAPDGIDRIEIEIGYAVFEFAILEMMIEESIKNKTSSDIPLVDIFDISVIILLKKDIIVYVKYLDKLPNVSATTDKNRSITINSYFYEKRREFLHKKNEEDLSKSKDKNNPEMRIRSDGEGYIRRKVCHELQHIIQSLGHLDSGNSLNKMVNDYIKKYNCKPNADQLIQHHKKFLGEFEAYEIENRIDFSQKEINENPIVYPDDIIINDN